MRAHVLCLSVRLALDSLLQISNVRVEFREVLLYDLRQLLDLRGGVSKQTPPSGHCGEGAKEGGTT